MAEYTEENYVRLLSNAFKSVDKCVLLARVLAKYKPKKYIVNETSYRYRITSTEFSGCEKEMTVTIPDKIKELYDITVKTTVLDNVEDIIDGDRNNYTCLLIIDVSK